MENRYKATLEIEQRVSEGLLSTVLNLIHTAVEKLTEARDYVQFDILSETTSVFSLVDKAVDRLVTMFKDDIDILHSDIGEYIRAEEENGKLGNLVMARDSTTENEVLDLFASVRSMVLQCAAVRECSVFVHEVSRLVSSAERMKMRLGLHRAGISPIRSGVESDHLPQNRYPDKNRNDECYNLSNELRFSMYRLGSIVEQLSLSLGELLVTYPNSSDIEAYDCPLCLEFRTVIGPDGPVSDRALDEAHNFSQLSKAEAECWDDYMSLLRSVDHHRESVVMETHYPVFTRPDLQEGFNRLETLRREMQRIYDMYSENKVSLIHLVRDIGQGNQIRVAQDIIKRFTAHIDQVMVSGRQAAFSYLINYMSVNYITALNRTLLLQKHFNQDPHPGRFERRRTSLSVWREPRPSLSSADPLGLGDTSPWANSSLEGFLTHNGLGIVRVDNLRNLIQPLRKFCMQ